MDFFDTIRKRAEKEDTLLCVGLDPSRSIATGEDVTAQLVRFCLEIVEKTHLVTLCYKPNIAFFERYGAAGLAALKQVMEKIPADVPVIMDAKRNDIGNTAKAYADEIFGHFGAQAVTLNGYLGKESVQPFLDYAGRGLFVLARTSNPSSDKIQLLETTRQGKPAEPLFLAMAKEASSWSRNVGLVVAGNETTALSRIRRELPGVWLLAPGIGAQGGTVEDAIAAGADRDGLGIIPVVVRHIIEDADPAGRARQFRDAIRKARGARTYAREAADPATAEKKNLIRRLVAHGCFKVGSFTLKSGATSPFYLDLRKLISDPGLLAQVARMYISLLEKLSFSRVSAIPVASVPVCTLISQFTGTPLIYPRIPVKTHGSGAPIDGDYEKGERVVLIDDLITTGLSKIEAIEVLRREGLVIDDLVVLIERGKAGRKDMESAGVTLHAALSIEDIVACLEEDKAVSADKIAEIRAYLATP